ncbi:MAG: hypothetical protein F2813_04125 [Actinobacteria bacterium]|uniref:Unannotated protein n=1 Tax=freshwater metagenome TaxID=449393 RepID=A0A6J5ZSP2_9ZZZZ|nr:hypothetical protein [Actinomycetota bacterium]
MSWIETQSPNFVARHAEEDDSDADEVLELLEGTREELAGVFEQSAGGLTVVIHSNQLQLLLAQPVAAALRLLTTPASRRYVAGWYSRSEIHVLAPRLLSRRASNVPGSLEMLMLSPASLYAQLTAGLNNPGLPPPFTFSNWFRAPRWAWLSAGAGQWFSGQTVHARPAIASRLRDGRRPSFPPGLRDAQLLGGSVFDLVASESGTQAAIELATTAPQSTAEIISRAFPGRSFADTEGVWRAHLARLGGV